MPSSVLIVEDDGGTRLGLAELLQDAGYTVAVASTFEEGLRKLRANPPDLLIADVRLGPFNGLQLVISSPHAIPAIMITGFADPVLEADARARGAEYLLKPVNPSTLLQIVKQKLAAAEAGYGIRRRWERKRVTSGLTADVSGEPARVLDVSYGGLRFELARPDRPPPTSLWITLPGEPLSVRAELVWKSLVAGQKWLCGAAVSPETADSPVWAGLVDAVS